MQQLDFKNVVITPADVIDVLFSQAKLIHPKLSIVYNEQLEHESAIKKFRSDNDLSDDEAITYPLLAIKRSVLKHEQAGGAGRRVGRSIPVRRINNDYAIKYKQVHAEFDLSFAYFHTEVEHIERFEIAYLAEQSFNQIKEIRVKFPAPVGGLPEEVFPYYFHWDVLSEKTFSLKELYYKTVLGRAKVYGFFFVIHEQQKVIKTINAKFWDCTVQEPGKLLTTVTLQAEE